MGKGMLVQQRYDNIIKRLNELGSVRVAELSKVYGVTEETIRRDLQQLERLGKLRRSHGGAVKATEVEERSEVPYFEREVMHVAEKRKIAEEAVQHIAAHERIILDASSTAWYMAAIMPNIPLTVLTNSIKIATELVNKPNMTIISTGGTLMSSSLSYIGPFAERFLEQYYVDKAFISCKGIDLKRGISEIDEFQGRMKQGMIDIAQKVYVMADFSKFGVNSFTHVAPCDAIDVLIADKKADDAMCAEFAALNIQVIKV